MLRMTHQTKPSPDPKVFDLYPEALLPVPHPHDEVAELAGCTVAGDAMGGTLLRCPTHEDVVAACYAMALREPGPRTVELANLLRVGCPGPAVDVTHARKIQAWIQLHVQFVEEFPETFQAPDATIQRLYGDCDDQCILAMALARELGVTARIVPFARGKGWSHVAMQYHLTVWGVWVWGETTLGARFGEHPQEARKRISAAGRGDIGR